MRLKQYQEDALSVLRKFFEESLIAGPKEAYETITQEPELAERLGRYGGRYAAALSDLPQVPYACLRLPTGGGKTILAAHAVKVTRDAWIQREYLLVLWLVPTNTIREQTVQTLKDNRHPYRQVLDDAFNGRVRVFDIAEFTHIRPQDIRDSCCVVVGTIQTLRVNDRNGRRVYAHNENMETHFSSLRATPPGLERLDNGGVKFSFANLLHLHSPLMIVDEAHSAVTGLTREMQTRLNPCAIVEFTATPRENSNTLYNVTAQELKQESMIKLPVRLSENDTWQSTISGAVAKRAELARIAQGDEAYLRPIVLFQAQNKNQELNVDALKNYLIDVERVPEDKIAVATGNRRELDGVDLFSPQCPIEYIITVEALREGWDCSFAYIFCSVSRIQNARNVEQLFGRVLRMPFAKRRRSDELNRAYAYVSEPTFGDAARALTDKLVSMGFEEEEAQDSIQSEIPGVNWLNQDGDMFTLSTVTRPTFTHTVSVSPENLDALKAISHGRVTVRETGEGKAEIIVVGGIDSALANSIGAAAPEIHSSEIAEAIQHYQVSNRHLFPPAERGEKIIVPRLMTEIQGMMKVADTDIFMEYHDWSLLNHPARLEEGEFTIRDSSRHFEIDIDGRRVTHQFLNEQEQFALDFDVEGWTPENLVIWLDRQVHQIDIHQSELLKWLTDMVSYLTSRRGMNITALTRCKYLLAQKVRNKITDFRVQERQAVHRNYLFAPDAHVEVAFDAAFEFKEGMYPDVALYRGHWKANKHFLGSDNLPKFDGVAGGEEEQCAQVLDSLPSVKFWLRNVSQHAKSFWLPTVSDRFYPDFVAQLEDGRIFVVEYKGEHIAESSDTQEKRTVGALWERRSNGRAIFLVVEKERDGLDMRGQMKQRVAGSSEEHFLQLLSEWRKDTAFQSSPRVITSHSAYQKIIDIGEPALPFIFEDMRKNGGWWYPALRAITGDNPVPRDARGNRTPNDEAWLRWGQDNGYA